MTQSLCLPFFVLRTTQASQLLSQFSQVVEGFVGYESGYRASRYIKTTESKKKKTAFFFFAFEKGRPSFLIYLSLHLNISLFALCTCCLHKNKSPQTEA